MSRCFPYKPRVCVRKGLNGEAALIESIKLQNATEMSKTSRRREEKKVKTGKTKEERKKLSSCHGDDKVKTPSEHKKVKEQRKAGSKRKHTETGNEPVERSDLTVERGRPFFSQNTGYLSDSPQSSDKRSGNALSNHCDPQKRRVIRIRLVPGNLSKQKMETAHQQLENSHAKWPTETIQGLKPEENRLAESVSALCSDDKPKINFPCLAPDNKVSISSRDRNSSSNDGLHSLEITYRNLTDHWTPLPLQLKAGDVVDDFDWLFGTVQSVKRSKNPSVNGQKSTIDNQSCQSSSLWPRAQYLPEGGLYALPYTVPF